MGLRTLLTRCITLLVQQDRKCKCECKLFVPYSEKINGVSVIDRPHLNPVTMNPVIRISFLGQFFCPRDSEAFLSNSEPGACNHLF